MRFHVLIWASQFFYVWPGQKWHRLVCQFGGSGIFRMLHNRKGLSNVIVVLLSLIILVIIVENVVLWGYQMNQFDLERMHENLKIANVASVNGTVTFTFQNDGPDTIHLLDLWIDNATLHQRYEMNLYVNSGDTTSYSQTDVSLPNEPYTIRIVTDRGNIFIYSPN